MTHFWIGFIWFGLGYLSATARRLVREVLEEHAHEVQKYQSLRRAVEEANVRSNT